MTRRDGVFLLLAAALVGFYVFLADQKFAIGFPLDDAWIHQVYARNLAEHGEWAFVAGEASAASTAPLYSALLALGNLVNLTPFAWAYLLGILALALGAMMAARLGEQLFPHLPYVGWATGLAILLAWHQVWAAASGMETMLFMGLSLTVLWVAFREASAIESSPKTARQAEKQAIRQQKWVSEWLKPRAIAQRGGWLGVISGLLTLTRPEGIVLVGLIGVLMWLAVGVENPRRYLIWGSAVAVGWLIIIAPYTAWNYDLTGDLLPATAQAKIAETAPFRADSIPVRYAKMLLPMVAGSQVLLLPAMAVGVWLSAKKIRSERRYWLYLTPVLWAFAHLTIYVLRLPAPFQHGRYVMPILPPLLLYGVGGMIYLVQTYQGTPFGRVLTRTLALSTVLSFPGFLWIGGQAYGNDVRIINTEMVETAKWVRDEVPPTDLFAVHDIGALGYYAPRDILDLAGLVSPEIVPIINDYPAQMELICQRGAKWLMVLPDQRPALANDPRLLLRYESPYDFADDAQGDPEEAWKMRVYELQCP